MKYESEAHPSVLNWMSKILVVPGSGVILDLRTFVKAHDIEKLYEIYGLQPLRSPVLTPDQGKKFP